MDASIPIEKCSYCKGDGWVVDHAMNCAGYLEKQCNCNGEQFQCDNVPYLNLVADLDRIRIFYERLLNKNHQTGIVTYIQRIPSQPILSIDGVRTSYTHKYFNVDKNEWVEAQTIITGDNIQGKDMVHAVGSVFGEGVADVFELSVSGETYYVGTFLSHNKICCGSGIGTPTIHVRYIELDVWCKKKLGNWIDSPLVSGMSTIVIPVKVS